MREHGMRARTYKNILFLFPRAVHPVSGRVVELYSNQPGVQFYTGNLLPDPDRIIEVSAAKEWAYLQGLFNFTLIAKVQYLHFILYKV